MPRLFKGDDVTSTGVPCFILNDKHTRLNRASSVETSRYQANVTLTLLCQNNVVNGSCREDRDL